MNTELSDQELELYSRHIMLDEISIAGQEKLKQAKIVVIGAGGLGCPTLLYLAAAGVGNISICDFDKVEVANLQRQVLFSNTDLNEAKVTAAIIALKSINNNVNYSANNIRVDATNVAELIKDHDLVIDACDNFATRHVVNQTCAKQRINLVAGAAEKYDGQVFAFKFQEQSTPCYNCIYPNTNEDIASTPCAVLGVFSPLTGVIGSIMAAEAIRFIVGFTDKGLQSTMLSYDILKQRVSKINLVSDKNCRVCNN